MNQHEIDHLKMMAAEYAEVLHLANTKAPLSVSDAVEHVRENREHWMPVHSSADLPTVEESTVFEPTEPVSVEQRLLSLERKIDTLFGIGNLPSVNDPVVATGLEDLRRQNDELAASIPETRGMGMDGLVADVTSTDEDESIITERRVMRVIPDGYPMPALLLAEAQEQYVDAVAELESAKSVMLNLGQNWEDIALRPINGVKLAIALLPLVEAIVDETWPQLNLDVQKVTIPRSLAELARTMMNSSTAQRVALDEFVEWAMVTLRDLDESRVRDNMIASGMMPPMPD